MTTHDENMLVPVPEPDGLVPGKVLAERLGVSAQTVWNWSAEKVGMPVARRETRWGKEFRWYDADACVAWAKQYRPALLGAGVGGTREGAGRPTSMSASGRRMGRPPGRKNGPRPGASGAGEPAALPLMEAVETDGASDRFRDPPPAPSQREGETGPAVEKVLLENRERRLKIEQRELELAQMRGEMVKLADMSAGLAAAMDVFRQRLEKSPVKCAGELMSVLGLEGGGEQRLRIEQVIAAEIESARRDLVEAVGKMTAA